MALVGTARVQAIEPSATMAIADIARRMRSTGADVIDLVSGDPDFATPRAVSDRLSAAVENGYALRGKSWHSRVARSHCS